MKKLILLIFIFNCLIAEAQLPSWQWAHSAGRYTSHDYCYGLATDQNGNSYITGEFQDTIDFGSTTLINSGSYGEMMFITKYDAMGNILWAQNPAGMNGSTGKSVFADKNSYFYVTGSYRGTITLGTSTFTSTAISAYFVAKYDSTGNVVWARNAISNDAQVGNSVCVDNNGNVFVTGTFGDSSITFGNVTLPPGIGIINTSIFLVKYDDMGNVLWAKAAATALNSKSNCVKTDINGNAFITGDFRNSITFGSTTLVTSMGAAGVFTVKFDVSGNVVWAKGSGGFPSVGYGQSIGTDVLGNAYVTGYFGSQIMIFDNDTLNNSGVTDIFLVKYDSLGNLIWTKSTGGSGYDQPSSMLTDSAGNCYITGFIKSYISFGGNNLSAVNQDVFVMKYDNIGNEVWGVQAMGNINEYGRGIGMDKNHDIYIGGTFTSPNSFFGTNQITNSDLFTSGYDLFVAKLQNVPTPVYDIENSNSSFRIFPNPFTNSTMLVFKKPLQKKFTIEIYNPTGQLCRYISNIVGDSVIIEKNNLTAGIYFLRINFSSMLQETVKLVIE
jgi:hypothetical protein